MSKFKNPVTYQAKGKEKSFVANESESIIFSGDHYNERLCEREEDAL